MWFHALEVVKNDGDLTEICLNIGEIGHDHIRKFYLNDLEIILSMKVKLILDGDAI